MLSVKTLTVGPMQSNCYILYNGSDAVVIDPGADETYIYNTINDMNLNVRRIILTHGHFDHIGAVGYLKDKFNCDVYIHKNDFEFLNNPSLNLSIRFNFPIVYSSDCITLTDETVNLIGHDFFFISTPGHTPGSMCIKVDNYIFTGDTLFKCSIGRAFEPYGDIELEIKSIKEKLLPLDNNLKCLTGHGDSTTIQYEKQFNPYLR